MKRLVYSPSVCAWVKTDTGVFDLSPYITNFSIDRRVNEVSSAALTFRNPKVPDTRDPSKELFLFTQNVANDGSVRPMFHPMDPIIITLTRIKGRPVQVFTGYCDTTPYVQLYPGTAQLTASCTLKRLMHTYWDPALPFVRDFMIQNGWFITDSGTAINANAEQKRGQLNDSSIGFLLYKVLTDVGGWDKDNINIQGLPPKIGELVANIYKNVYQEEMDSIKEFHDFLHKIVGAAKYGSFAGQPNLSGGTIGQSGTAPILPTNAPAVLQQWVQEADRIARHVTHYDQSNPPNTRTVNAIPEKDGAYIFDCSSFISYMMNFINRYDESYGQVSGWFARSWGAPGKGKYLTIWANDDHVFAEVKTGNQTKFIGTSGYIQSQNLDNSEYGHSHTIGWMSSYPTDGFTPRHVPGL